MVVIFILMIFEYFTSIPCVNGLFFWHPNFENFLKKKIIKIFLGMGLILADTNLSKNICRNCLGLPLHLCPICFLSIRKIALWICSFHSEKLHLLYERGKQLSSIYSLLIKCIPEGHKKNNQNTKHSSE